MVVEFPHGPDFCLSSKPSTVLSVSFFNGFFLRFSCLRMCGVHRGLWVGLFVKQGIDFACKVCSFIFIHCVWGLLLCSVLLLSCGLLLFESLVII